MEEWDECECGDEGVRVRDEDERDGECEGGDDGGAYDDGMGG